MNTKNIQQYIPENAKTEIFDNTVRFEVQALDIKEVFSGLYRNKNLQIKLITATDERANNGCFKIWYIFGIPKENIFIIPFVELKNTEEFPSVSSIFHGADNYERKIQTFFGLTPVGNPDQRPIILHENWPDDIFPLRKDFDWQKRPKKGSWKYEFQKVEGEGIYEIPVGPIHAGIIEPGHFRFSVAGESIVLLDPRLGFVHKGSEKLFEILPVNEKIRLSEKISGDTSFSHCMAFCQALEKLSGTVVPKRAQYLRVIYAELERLANHFGDIGAIMTDTGFNFGGANGARLREIIMQINERLTDSRFLRGVNVIGGVTKDINDEQKNKLSDDLEATAKDFSEVIEVAENSASLFNRLKGTGKLSYELAKDRGALGIAAKAVGIPRDARVDFPYEAYEEAQMNEVETEQNGDVCARFYVRIKEVNASIKIIRHLLRKLPGGATCEPNTNIVFKANVCAVTTVEGWRGEIVYFVTTDSKGNISRVVPHDPSFVNWSMVGGAGFDNVVPDFPLINKSFNLSYSGNDL
ncbi:MAG: NADH-quinone oxidoreductase subunit C [Candidatus Peregrinibacteria bacterium]|nr:NADH-quinone oxidoreductase subunit C [Candidatus Peregrinibacteria bacterium]